jgi:hypothetical protein
MASLKLTVHLWTDKTPEGIDCWDYGVIHVPVLKNAEYGISVSGDKGVKWNKPEDMYGAMLTALERAGVSVGRYDDLRNSGQAATAPAEG